jgi:hypothetical protein
MINITLKNACALWARLSNDFDDKQIQDLSDESIAKSLDSCVGEKWLIPVAKQLRDQKLLTFNSTGVTFHVAKFNMNQR